MKSYAMSLVGRQSCIIKGFSICLIRRWLASRIDVDGINSVEGVSFNGVLKHKKITWVIERLSEAFNLVHQAQSCFVQAYHVTMFFLSFCAPFHRRFSAERIFWLMASWRKCVVLAINFLLCRFLTDSSIECREGAQTRKVMINCSFFFLSQLFFYTQLTEKLRRKRPQDVSLEWKQTVSLEIRLASWKGAHFIVIVGFIAFLPPTWMHHAPFRPFHSREKREFWEAHKEKKWKWKSVKLRCLWTDNFIYFFSHATFHISRRRRRCRLRFSWWQNLNTWIVFFVISTATTSQ